MSERSVDQLVSNFARAVLSQREAIRAGDSRSGNRHARAYVAAARALLDRGERAIDSFCSLLGHASEDVRGMAAAFLLSTRPQRAVETLERIAEGTGLAALGAQETLKRYQRGEFDIR